MTTLDPPHDADLTKDDFLGGRLQLLQPRAGYRAGIDPVVLAASVEARKGQSILDLGCGVGTAALCIGRRVPGVSLVGLEVQEPYADLARRNGALNGLLFDVVTGDVAQMPDALKAQQFDHVIANPPYFDRAASTRAPAADKERALGENTALSVWVNAAAKRAAPGGTVSFIHRAERLPDLLDLVGRHLGSLELLPLAPRDNRPARLVLLRDRKGGRADFRIYAPWVLHAGSRHQGDRESYTEATVSVLRDGAALHFS